MEPIAIDGLGRNRFLGRLDASELKHYQPVRHAPLRPGDLCSVALS